MISQALASQPEGVERMVPMSTLAPSQKVVTHLDSKFRKPLQILEAQYDKAQLTEEEAQRVNDAAGLAELIANFIAANRVTDQFKNEEVRSNYGYPKQYKGSKPIAEQIMALNMILGLDPASALEYAKNLPQVPNGAEKWFAVPSVPALAAKHFPEVTDPAEQYCRAVQLIHEKLAASRTFHNYREGEITADRFRMTAKTAEAMDRIMAEQKGDILIIAAQLGMRHCGRSVRCAREVFVTNEFGLGSLAVGSILLTHPEREVEWEQLHMDCPGDEFSPKAAGKFSYAPCFHFHVDLLKFDTSGVSNAHEHYGSASALLPQ